MAPAADYRLSGVRNGEDLSSFCNSCSARRQNSSSLPSGFPACSQSLWARIRICSSLRVIARSNGDHGHAPLVRWGGCRAGHAVGFNVPELIRSCVEGSGQHTGEAVNRTYQPLGELEHAVLLCFVKCSVSRNEPMRANHRHSADVYDARFSKPRDATNSSETTTGDGRKLPHGAPRLLIKTLRL
jgi:hypothetical protein